MRRSLLMVVAVLMACGSASANPLFFAGQARTANVSPVVLGSFVLSNVGYTPSATANAVLNSASLALSMNGSSTVNFTDLKGGLPAGKNRVRVASANTLTINANWVGDTGNAIGTSSTELILTVVSSQSVGSLVASQANVNFLIANAVSVIGSLSVNGQGSLPDTDYDLTGFSAVPEPSTWCVLAGVGAVVGRRCLKRRRAAAAV